MCYDVHSFQADYADCGSLQVYAGVDPADLPAALKLILGELALLRDEPVSVEELAKARAFAGGRLELRLEESRHLASWLGVQEALHERVLSLDEVLENIERVTPDKIQELAGRLFRDEALSLAVITPRRRSASLERALRLP
jgi:predicted Zn-dependent peptidase